MLCVQRRFHLQAAHGVTLEATFAPLIYGKIFKLRLPRQEGKLTHKTQPWLELTTDAALLHTNTLPQQPARLVNARSDSSA